jgi:hypothetical protein
VRAHEAISFARCGGCNKTVLMCADCGDVIDYGIDVWKVVIDGTSVTVGPLCRCATKKEESKDGS